MAGRWEGGGRKSYKAKGGGLLTTNSHKAKAKAQAQGKQGKVTREGKGGGGNGGTKCVGTGVGWVVQE